MVDKKIRLAINGFGRIGRNVLRTYFKNYSFYKDKFEIVAINDITNIQTLFHLLKYDTTHGVFPEKAFLEENILKIRESSIQLFSEREVEKLPWKTLDIDIAIESTGLFLTKEKASLHIVAGAKKVLISAPSKGAVDATVVFGVNDNLISQEKNIYSNASCTTNCLAPVAKVLEDEIGIESGFMTTVHAFTNDQRLVDSPHSDLRRARAAANSLIPTSTGATKAVEQVIPSLKEKLQGHSIRVPIVNGSITDFTVKLKRKTSVEEVNQILKKASEGAMKGIIEYQTDPIVSIDIIGNPHSGIVDSLSTQIVSADPSHVRVVIWYDNEWGYSNRLLDISAKIGQTI